MRSDLSDLLADDLRAENERLRPWQEELVAAVDFIKRVKASSRDEQIAVGCDHWDRLEAAATLLAAALHKQEDV